MSIRWRVVVLMADLLFEVLWDNNHLLLVIGFGYQDLFVEFELIAGVQVVPGVSILNQQPCGLVI